MLRLTKVFPLDGKMLLGVDPYLIFLGSLSCCLPAALSRHGHVRAAVQRGFGGAARGTADVVRPGTTAVLGSVAEAPPLILNCINLKSVYNIIKLKVRYGRRPPIHYISPTRPWMLFLTKF